MFSLEDSEIMLFNVYNLFNVKHAENTFQQTFYNRYFFQPKKKKKKKMICHVIQVVSKGECLFFIL